MYLFTRRYSNLTGLPTATQQVETSWPIIFDPTTLRLSLVDIAGKIVSHGGRIVMKVTAAVMTRLRFDVLWDKCTSPPPIPPLPNFGT